MGVGRSLLLLAVGALLHADAANAQRLGELWPICNFAC